MERSTLVDVAVAPLTWLERARGWRRLALLALYAAVVTVGGFFAWREGTLRRIPWMAEPFDVAKYGTVDVPDRDNAMIGYAEAARLIRPVDNSAVMTPAAWAVTGWSGLDPGLRRWVEANRPALAAYLVASERPDALLVQPKDHAFDTRFDTMRALDSFSWLARREAARLEESGDPAGAWRLYRGMLRASRHVGRHGGVAPRMNGHRLLMEARTAAMAWAGHPEVTPDMLRRGIDDVAQCLAMTSPASETIRAEYFASLSLLDHPEAWVRMGIEEDPENSSSWYDRYPIVPWARRFASHEPERSRRLLRLIVAGQLAQCDRPRSLRPGLAPPRLTTYLHDEHTPPAVRSIDPAELDERVSKSKLASAFISFPSLLTRVDFEPGALEQLRLTMAERAFTLDRGRPPKTYGELVGPYLKALPDGIEPSEPTIAGPDAP